MQRGCGTRGCKKYSCTTFPPLLRVQHFCLFFPTVRLNFGFLRTSFSWSWHLFSSFKNAHWLYALSEFLIAVASEHSNYASVWLPEYFYYLCTWNRSLQFEFENVLVRFLFFLSMNVDALSSSIIQAPWKDGIIAFLLVYCGPIDAHSVLPVVVTLHVFGAQWSNTRHGSLHLKVKIFPLIKQQFGDYFTGECS